MNRLIPALAALLLATPLAAEEVMVPGTPYRLSGNVTEAARVVVHSDSRVLVWEVDVARPPKHQGDWSRRGRQICIMEESEHEPLCLDEVARADGAFSLTEDELSLDFTPLDD